MKPLYEFHFINDQLMNMGSVNSASELQGLLCGRLCTGEQLSGERWQQLALAFMDLEFMIPSEEQSALLALLLMETQASLQDDQLVFMPLLPDDHAGLVRRSQELASWCEGFLHGLGQSIGNAGLKEGDELPEEVSDALRDIARISQAEVEGDTQELEKNEVYWVELVEYVKVAVLTIYAELALKNRITDQKMH